MPQDRRIRKSQQAIRQAFIDLLHKQELEQMEDEQVKEIKVFIEENDVYSNKAISADNIRTIMEFLIGNIEENMSFYQLMFNIGKDSNLHEKLYELITGHLNHFKNDNNKIGNIPFSYFMSYVSGAGLSFIRQGS